MKKCGSFGRRFFAVSLSVMTTLSLFASSGQASAAPPPHRQRIGDLLRIRSGNYSYEIDLKTLACTIIYSGNSVMTEISRAAFSPAEYEIDEDLSEISYPELGLDVRLDSEDVYLRVSISSQKPQKVRWPSVVLKKKETALIWPYLEGNYIPLSDDAWRSFLGSRRWNTTEGLYLPFWGIERGRGLLSYLVENPFHNEIIFKERGGTLQMEFTHVFPGNADLGDPITFRIYPDTDATPITPAKHFRQYLKDRNSLITLEEKIRTAPLVSRLIGAPHAYVWDGAPLSITDVKEDAWIPFARAIVEQIDSDGMTAGKRILRAIHPEKGNFSAMARQATAYPYMRRGMAWNLSRALSSSDLYDASVWPLASLPIEQREIAEKILAGKKVDAREAVSLNGFLLYASFPEYLNPPSTWGNGVSTRMIDALARNGMDRFVLTCNGIENIEIRPRVASYATEKGYLIGPYDSYHGVQDPDAPEWPTAVFDRALYENGGIVRSNGKPVAGFLGVGHYVSPLAVKPYFQARIAENFRKAPHSYYFLDCDAFGEFYDDYRPGRIVGASEDAAARVDRVRSIFEKYKVPVGSEGGSYLFASFLTTAEGVFFPVITGDADMEFNELSRYFLGRPFPADESERLFMSAQLKEKYVRLYADPRFRLPLYETVFHDSVVTTSHYASSSLKFTNIAETTALTEILYQVAPMYHLNLNNLDTLRAKIKPHIDVFEKTHSYSYRYALEEFAFLTEEHDVQKTRFGDLELIANFRDEPFVYRGTALPARSVSVTFLDTGESFIYRNPALSDETGRRTELPALIRELSDTDAGKRERAALAVSEIGPAAKAGVPALITALGDQEWNVRAAAAKALANMDGDAADALPALMAALRDEEWQVRRAAAYAVATLGRKAKKAVPLLIGLLGDEEWHMRRAAATALGAVGDSSAKTIRGLEARLTDPELQVRMAAEKAIVALGGRPSGGGR